MNTPVKHVPYWRPIEELVFADNEDKTTIFCTVTFLFSTRQGKVFEGYAHKNGWVYSSDKNHAIPLEVTTVTASECTSHLNVPAQTDRVIAYRSLPLSWNEIAARGDENIRTDRVASLRQTIEFLNEQQGNSHQGYFGPTGLDGSLLQRLLNELLKEGNYL